MSRVFSIAKACSLGEKLCWSTILKFFPSQGKFGGLWGGRNFPLDLLSHLREIKSHKVNRGAA